MSLGRLSHRPKSRRVARSRNVRSTRGSRAPPVGSAAKPAGGSSPEKGTGLGSLRRDSRVVEALLRLDGHGSKPSVKHARPFFDSEDPSVTVGRLRRRGSHLSPGSDRFLYFTTASSAAPFARVLCRPGRRAGLLRRFTRDWTARLHARRACASTASVGRQRSLGTEFPSRPTGCGWNRSQPCSLPSSSHAPILEDSANTCNNRHKPSRRSGYRGRSPGPEASRVRPDSRRSRRSHASLFLSSGRSGDYGARLASPMTEAPKRHRMAFA